MSVPETPRTLTRRTLLKGLLAGSVGLATGMGAYGYAYERVRLGITRVSLPIAGLPDAFEGLRVGLLTDLHHSRTVPAHIVTHAVDLVLSERPDLIVLGGDYVTWGDDGYTEPCAELLARLTAPHGVFAVLGNHDHDRDVTAALARQGFDVLRDARTRLFIRGEGLDIAGVRFWTRQVREIAPVLRAAEGPTLMLAHDPRRITEAAALNVQAVLSGHTHGGQVVLPGVGAILGRKFPILEGLAVREHTSIFVSRGVGTVYLPFRLNCPPEVALVTLTRRRPARTREAMSRPSG